MKQYFRITMLWLAVAMIAPMLTSCDEFFGLIDNPVTPALRVYTETLVVGEGHSLKIDATTQDHVMLTYASSNPSIAIVDAEGNVIGVSEGKATITVTAQGDDDYYRNQIFGTNTHTVDVAVVKYDPTAIKLLADAQKEGALVSITFNLDGTDYIAYFRLVNGEYVLQDGPAAARAAARAAAPAATRGVTRTIVEVDDSHIIWGRFNDIDLLLKGLFIVDDTSGSGLSGSSTSGSSSGTPDPEHKLSDLIATWVDKTTGNAIAQAQIDGATAAVTMVQAAAADVSGHAVEMKKVEVNDVPVCDSNIQTQADDVKASEKAATGGAGDSADGGGGKSGGSGGGSNGGGGSSGGSSSFSVTKAEFSPAIVEMLSGETLQLKYSYSPSNAKVNFSTENSDLITIDEKTGEVKALAEGQALVKMNTTASDGTNICVATCKINIADQDKLNTFYNNLSGGLEITSEIADNWNIENLVGDFADKFDEINMVYAESICKKICEKNMLKKVILLYGGNAQKGYNLCYFTNNYFWLNYWPASSIPSNWIDAKLFYVQKAVTSITLSSSTLKLVVGEADVTLTATVKPDDAADKTVTWSSDNEAAATVVDGKVHAVAAGNATITAKAGDKTATCAITVLAESLTPQNARKM